MSKADPENGKWNERSTLERRFEERTAELKASEERFRTIVEHAPEAIVVFDADRDRFVECNENACRLFGVTREQLLAMSPAEVSPERQPDGRPSREAAAEQLTRALEGETPSFAWVHKHSSGRPIMCEVRIVALPGEARLLRGSITDMTDRARRERIQQATYEISEAVHDVEDLTSLYARIHQIIRNLMPANNFYIAVLDPVTSLIHFPYFVDQLATSPPEPREVTTGLTGYVLRTGKPLLMDRKRDLRRRIVGDAVLVEGMEVPYVESGRPAAIWLGAPLTIGGKTFGVMAVQDYQREEAYGEDDKQILTFIAAQTAITIQRKRNEQALRESEEKFRALFEASSQGVMLHDEKQYLEVNPAAVRILGYKDASELIGRHPADTSAPTQPNGEAAGPLARRYIQQCIETGNARFEWLARTPAGEDIHIEVILTRIRMSGRQMIQAVIDDITERKRAEEELHKALAREKELGQLKSNFVAMVSHEFRTPLGIIMSSADILRDYLEQLDPEERHRHLDSIHKNTRRMADLMEEVLLLGSFDAGKVHFAPVSLDICASLAKIAAEVGAVSDGTSRIRYQYKPVSVQGYADERLLRHIFTNLLSNAVKYSPSDSDVTFSVEREATDALIRVEDHGIGIPEADKPWLFHAFQRGANVGQRPGTGLGLVIVKRCVELHRGTVTLESKAGEGTRVTVRLPVYGGRVPMTTL